MSRIIINIRDGISEEDAIYMVKLSMESGRISSNKNGKHYCWMTTFKTGEAVSVTAKKKGQTSDIFNVFKYKD